MYSHFFFWVGLAFILTHEMDAVQRHEWRIFPLTFWLDDKWGYWAFTGVHVPLYVALFWYLVGDGSLNISLVRGLNIFFMIHVGLHLLFLRHPKNEFTGLFSWLIIVGAGVAGLLDLLMGG